MRSSPGALLNASMTTAPTNITQADALARLGVYPSDFASPNRERRMWACAMRGDLQFEGVLLSNALELNRYQPILSGRRYFHHQFVIDSPHDKPELWNDLPVAAQIEFIDGYAAAVAETYGIPGDRYWWAGYERGVSTSVVARALDGGQPVAALTVVAPEAPARTLRLEGVVRDTKLGHGYVARISSGQYRTHYFGEGEMRAVPWQGSYHFEVDAIL